VVKLSLLHDYQPGELVVASSEFLEFTANNNAASYGKRQSVYFGAVGIVISTQSRFDSDSSNNIAAVVWVRNKEISIVNFHFSNLAPA
jgi:hypothetical protein